MNNYRPLILLSLLAFVAPSSLFADPAPIYVWGSGDVIAEVFRAVSQTTGEMNAALTSVALAIGGLIIIFKFAGMSSKPISPFELVRYPALVIILQQVFLSTNVAPQYMVVDETTETPYSVGRLPVGIGESFSLFSQLQRSILIGLDKFYTTPDSISFRNSGLGFAMSVHDNIAVARPLNPVVTANFNSYLEDCLVNESARDPSFKRRIENSPDLLSAMEVRENFLTTYYSSEDGSVSVDYCPNVWEKMKTDVMSESRRYLKRLAVSMGYSSNTGSGVNPAFGDKAALVANHYFGMSADAEKYMTQAMLANMNNQGIRTMSALSGINLSAMAWMPAYAERRAQSAFYSSGILAHKYMPVMQSILLTIIISVSWILVLLTIALYDFKYIRLLITLTLTLFLWMIISSIMNFSFDLQLQKAIASVTYDVTGGAYQMTYKDDLDSAVGDKLSVLGYISWLIPILAFALAKGSDIALANLFSSLAGAYGGATNIGSGAGVDRAAPGGFSSAGEKGITHVGSTGESVTRFGEQLGVYRAYEGHAGVGQSVTKTDETTGHSMESVTTTNGVSFTRDLATGQVTQASYGGFNANAINQQIARETNELANSKNNAKSAQENWANTAQSSINDQVSNALSSKEAFQTMASEADKNGYGDQFRIAFCRATLKNWDSISQHIENADRAQEFKQTISAGADGKIDAASRVSNNSEVIDAVSRAGQMPTPGDATDKRIGQTTVQGSGSAHAGASFDHTVSSSRGSSDSIGQSTGNRGSHQTSFISDFNAYIAKELSLDKSHMAAYEQSLSKSHSETAGKLRSHSNAYSEALSETASHMDKISAMKTMGDTFSSSMLAAAMNNAAASGIDNDTFMGLMVDYVSSGNYEAAASMVSGFGGTNAYGGASAQVGEGAGSFGSVGNTTSPDFAKGNLNVDPKAAYNQTSGGVAGEYRELDRVKDAERNIGSTAEDYRTPSNVTGANLEAMGRGPFAEHLHQMNKGARGLANMVDNAVDSVLK
ncbi:MAG: conjugal transfer protein TraG N-terminal domain-containing protein [Helicobacteraceae bacterium]|jgi:conjugal transfer mating pair stabilization protein TraG|nr:conjugal transfer protein TraG N-terminal domain-containing protein [Helicobacteraceae bacterium]